MNDSPSKCALIVGNTDGIGLALTRRLLDDGWVVAGISKSASPVADNRYLHTMVDIRAMDYPAAVAQAATAASTRAGVQTIDVCVYCAGVGELLDVQRLERERAIFEVNLLGVVSTLEVLLPDMLKVGRGHFVGLSSQADRMRDPAAPSYGASKAGMSSYLEGMAKAVRAQGVSITNIRFGFVDTKMAKAESRPFIISADKAAALIVKCMERKPIRYTYPRRMAALLWVVRLFT